MPDKLVEFCNSSGVFELWVDGVKVTARITPNVEAMLKYFCVHPQARLSQNEFLMKINKLKGQYNPSRVKDELRKLLAETRPAAEAWFYTPVLHWADGVIVRERKKSSSV